MSLDLDGSTGYLLHSAKIVSSLPCTIVAWVGIDATGSAQFFASQTASGSDRYIAGWLDSNGVDLYGNLRNPGNGSSATKNTTVNATMKVMMAVFGSTTSRKMYYGSNVEATDTASLTDDITNHNRVVVGAYYHNGNSPSLFLNGNVAEVHFYNTALGDSDYDTLAGGALPETITGWVDGWALETYSAGGTYTSIGGSRTLTAVGGVATGTQGHPIVTTGRGGGSTYAPPVMRRGGAPNVLLTRF
jgi:hypothetical protein